MMEQNRSSQNEAGVSEEVCPDVVEENTNGDPDQSQSITEHQCCGCWHGWCSFPQTKTRRYRLIWVMTFLASIVALVLSDAAVDVCGFVDAVIQVPNSTGTIQKDGSTPYFGERRGVGINVYEDNDGECISWRKGEDKDLIYDESNEMWRTVRHIVGVASVIALIGVIVLGFVPCIALSTLVWQTLEIIWLGVWFLYSLSFILFGSDLCTDSNKPTIDNDETLVQRDCTFDIGAGLILAGVLVWIPSSYGVWYLAHTLNPKTSTRRHRSPNELSEEAALSAQEEPDQNTKVFLASWSLVSGSLMICSIVTNVIVIKHRS
jgi:hypothetical protein